MSQATNWSVPLSGPATPTVMASRMDDSFNALMTCHRGASRPTYLTSGKWLKDVSGSVLEEYFYDGTDDILCGTWDLAANTFTPAGLGEVLRPSNNLSDIADASAARTNLSLGTAAVATLGTGSGQVPTADQIPTIVPAKGIPVRQTALSGVSSNGQAAFITAGTGLRPGLLATASPLVLAFASGFGTSGAVDYIEQIATDSTTFFPTLPASNTSFLHGTRTGAGAVSGGSTLSPPQYGYTFNQAAQFKLDLDNSALDDFGNSWTNSNVTFSNTSPAIAGTYMGVFNGTSARLTNAVGFTFPQGGWTIRGKFKPAALPSSPPSYALLAETTNASGYGAKLVISNVSGVIKFAMMLSSNGTAFDIVSYTTQGTTTPVVGTSYDVELTFDSVAGAYRLYVNGVQEISVSSSSRICPVTSASIGATALGASWFNGSSQGVEFLPYCLHPAGTSFTPSTVLSDITAVGYASDWYDIGAAQMKAISAKSTVSGTLPTFSAVNKVYVGEATTNASAVASVVNYALQGRYDAEFSTTAVSTSKAHNLGTRPGRVTLSLGDVTQSAAVTLTRNSATWTASAGTSRLICERGW